MSHLFVVIMVLGTISCGGPTKAVSKANTALLLVDCEVNDAEVWLNSRYFRDVSQMRGGVRLKAGPHRVEVRHADFHSRYFELVLVAKERRKLEVELAPKLP